MGMGYPIENTLIFSMGLLVKKRVADNVGDINKIVISKSKENPNYNEDEMINKTLKETALTKPEIYQVMKKILSEKTYRESKGIVIGLKKRDEADIVRSINRALKNLVKKRLIHEITKPQKGNLTADTYTILLNGWKKFNSLYNKFLPFVKAHNIINEKLLTENNFIFRLNPYKKFIEPMYNK